MALADLLPPLIPLTLTLLLLSPIFLILLHDLKTWYYLPRGPLPLPFIGNKLQLSPERPYQQLQDWSRTYGPIYTIWTGRRPTLVINDPVIASELLERRSASFSSRPRMIAMGELLWANASILVQPYGRAWSQRRRLLHKALAGPALEAYKPVQEAEAARLCSGLLDLADSDARGFEPLLERFTASVVYAAAYGRRIDSLDAKVLKQRFAFMRYSSGLNVPGKYAVETFPWLKHVPAVLAPWKADILAHGKAETAANLALLASVEAELAQRGKDAVPPSFAKTLLLLDGAETHPLSRRDLAFLPASLFGAGSDTTASTLCSALLALVTHPHVQKRLHDELAAVVGDARLPTFADLPRLPYLRATVHETLRWRPVAALGGTPHASSRAAEYGPWRIPAGTTVLANSWGINLNEEVYAAPHVFWPERFLAASSEDAASISGMAASSADTTGEKTRVRHDPRTREEETASAEPNHPNPNPNPPPQRGGNDGRETWGHSSFGWGRRICPGAGLALNSLSMALACLVWGFDVMPACGREARVATEKEHAATKGPKPTGYDIFDYTPGFNIRPRALECRVRARSARHAEVVRREARRAMAASGGLAGLGAFE